MNDHFGLANARLQILLTFENVKPTHRDLKTLFDAFDSLNLPIDKEMTLFVRDIIYDDSPSGNRSCVCIFHYTPTFKTTIIRSIVRYTLIVGAHTLVE